MVEVCVVFQDGSEIRRLRGFKVEESSDGLFISLYRADGSIHKIARRLVDRIIEEGRHES